jgi:ornithine cyclodeaminase/alanine dehydrogenase-like protein (mu-crystallin family)
MSVLIINQSEVRSLLPMDTCMSLMASTLKALAQGKAINPLRHVMWLPQRIGVLGLMPAHVADIGKMGVKAISVFPGNTDTVYESHQGVVLLFEMEHGRLQAIVDASEITAIRTAAVSGVATRLLANQDAGRLAILGSGVQARMHLEAMRLARDIKQVTVWSRTWSHAQAFAQRETVRLGLPIKAVSTAAEAAAGADIICTTTSAAEPILKGDWLPPGVHMNAIGSSVPSARELDTVAIIKSRVFVDRRESTLNEAGDFLIPMQEGAIDADHIQGEIGEILLGEVVGRESSGQITLFKSLGLAVEDIAAASYVYQQAVEQEAGIWVDLGGLRQEHT